ncbi:MAG: hypothetical protein MUE71_05755 [Chitinophagaceae bacterium]|jgi:hypothetical protein|nr:hypothetical protein [Chitinophagaceae bacterium]MCU0404303.1 hypothetical protein [Chitinophagaceae bacterium]
MAINRIFSFFLFGSLLFISCAALAQNRKTINGAVLIKSENQPVRMASITNITIGKTTVSRGNGTFELEAGIGNIIAFGANGFYTDTLSITGEQFSSGTILLVLRPLPSTLTNVTVVGNYSQYQMDSIERRKSFLQDVGNSEIPAVSRANDMGFGVGINLDRWSKREKGERKARDIFQMMEEDAYVNFRWNEEVVKKYTSYEGEDLFGFMERNRPEYQWLRKNPTEEALLYYINSSLKKEKRKK